MITIFEGPRNSGKTFLANKFAQLNRCKIFKFEFADWFNRLELEDESESTHLFALGKEAMLLQLNRDAMLPDFVLDRGFLTVLTWGILSGRITESKANLHLEILAKRGLLENCKIVYVEGDNPNINTRNKDNWDFRENSKQEQRIMENLKNIIFNDPYNVKIEFIYNSFDARVIDNLKKI